MGTFPPGTIQLRFSTKNFILYSSRKLLETGRVESWEKKWLGTVEKKMVKVPLPN